MIDKNHLPLNLLLEAIENQIYLLGLKLSNKMKMNLLRLIEEAEF